MKAIRSAAMAHDSLQYVLPDKFDKMRLSAMISVCIKKKKRIGNIGRVGENDEGWVKSARAAHNSQLYKPVFRVCACVYVCVCVCVSCVMCRNPQQDQRRT